MKHLIIFCAALVTWLALPAAGYAQSVSKFQAAPAPLALTDTWSVSGPLQYVGFIDDGEHYFTYLGDERSGLLQVWRLPEVDDEPRDIVPELVADQVIDSGRVVDIQTVDDLLLVLSSTFEGQAKLEVFNRNLDLIDVGKMAVVGTPLFSTTTIERNMLISYANDYEAGLIILRPFEGMQRAGAYRLVGAVGKAWEHPAYDNFFVNVLGGSQLVAYPKRGGRTAVHGYESGFSSSLPSLHFAVDGRHLTGECDSVGVFYDSPFIVADYSQGTITAVTFSEFFEQFEIKSLVQKRALASRSVTIDRYEGVRYSRTPMRVSASCDRARILVTSNNAREVLQLSYNAGFEVLDSLPSVEVPFAPNLLAISHTGNRALVATSRTGEIALLEPRGTADPQIATLPDRGPAVRDLQRVLASLGYSVGAIDGLMGQRTEAAIQQLEGDLGVKLSRDDFGELATFIEAIAVGITQRSSSTSESFLTRMWLQDTIPVCWENPSPEHQPAMDLVRKSVSDSWEAHSRITFVGWSKCTSTASGVRITIEDSGPWTRSLGRRLAGLESGVVLNLTFEEHATGCKAHPETCIRGFAVYEFGKVLGFVLENSRPDTPLDCDLPRGGHSDFFFLGFPYDPESVMNLCNPKFANRGVLSEGDKQKLSFVYGDQRLPLE
ncbi:peptidoglycan-binding protein [Roseobacter sp. YSTF-M11]|uniref:Peptidoglycan-binding protein n=1 Tax=Roseobacter insulae TaxID=2859783 RepID=A0A9X1FT21_9RHOB|nr:peptidoglycan-binding domain-containing protein [Roseobacter insulae]MBW4706894.1 peptidoglycan-binding protein [Roseobacter insulae]